MCCARHIVTLGQAGGGSALLLSVIYGGRRCCGETTIQGRGVTRAGTDYYDGCEGKSSRVELSIEVVDRSQMPAYLP